MSETLVDDGRADPPLAAALAAWQAQPVPGTEARVHAALVTARLLVPIVPMPPEDGADGAGASTREMSRPTLIGADGRPATPAFTSVASMAGWRADARPVPASGSDVLAAAAEAHTAVVLDIAGPIPYTLEGETLALLAAGVIRLPETDELDDELASHPVAGGLSAVETATSTPPRLADSLQEALAPEPLVAEAYLLAPEPGPAASAVAVGLVLREEVTQHDLVALVRRLAETLVDDRALSGGVDIAVLTLEQRLAAQALGPAAYVAAPLP